IGTNADGVSDTLERNIISGNTSDGVRVDGAVNPVSNLTIADQLIAGSLPRTTATGTINQTDFSDANSPSNGNWSYNNAVPSGEGDNDVVVTTGTLQVNTAGTFSFAIAGDDGGRLRIDGVDVIVDNTTHGFAPAYGQATLGVGSHSFQWVGFDYIGGAG